MSVVTSGAFLTLHYRLCGPEGQAWIDTFVDKPATLSLEGGQLSPALEACLMGMHEGEHKTFHLAAGEAFGEHDPDKVQWVARKLLNDLGADVDALGEGDVVQFPSPRGDGANIAGSVVAVRDDRSALCFDFNHPLAGRETTFEVQLIGVL